MSRTAAEEKLLTAYVSREELALLKKLDFPCSETVLASAVPTDEGICLTGTHADFDSLIGWVAGEANDADRRRARRRANILTRIFEELDGALRSRAYGARW